jgi:hypothetical protein
MEPMNRRARKRARQQREADEARERFRFGLLAAEVLRGGGFADLGVAVVDVEVIPRLDGDPRDMFAWLIFATVKEATAAAGPASKVALLGRACRLLGERGFPAEALATFDIGCTSLPEIEAGGGRFSFFR